MKAFETEGVARPTRSITLDASAEAIERSRRTKIEHTSKSRLKKANQNREAVSQVLSNRKAAAQQTQAARDDAAASSVSADVAEPMRQEAELKPERTTSVKKRPRKSEIRGESTADQPAQAILRDESFEPVQQPVEYTGGELVQAPAAPNDEEFWHGQELDQIFGGENVFAVATTSSGPMRDVITVESPSEQPPVDMAAAVHDAYSILASQVPGLAAHLQKNADMNERFARLVANVVHKSGQDIAALQRNLQETIGAFATRAQELQRQSNQQMATTAQGTVERMSRTASQAMQLVAQSAENSQRALAARSSESEKTEAAKAVKIREIEGRERVEQGRIAAQSQDRMLSVIQEQSRALAEASSPRRDVVPFDMEAFSDTIWRSFSAAFPKRENITVNVQAPPALPAPVVNVNVNNEQPPPALPAPAAPDPTAQIEQLVAGFMNRLNMESAQRAERKAQKREEKARRKEEKRARKEAERAREAAERELAREREQQAPPPPPPPAPAPPPPPAEPPVQDDDPFGAPSQSPFEVSLPPAHIVKFVQKKAALLDAAHRKFVTHLQQYKYRQFENEMTGSQRESDYTEKVQADMVERALENQQRLLKEITDLQNEYRYDFDIDNERYLEIDFERGYNLVNDIPFVVKDAYSATRVFERLGGEIQDFIRHANLRKDMARDALSTGNVRSSEQIAQELISQYQAIQSRAEAMQRSIHQIEDYASSVQGGDRRFVAKLDDLRARLRQFQTPLEEFLHMFEEIDDLHYTASEEVRKQDEIRLQQQLAIADMTQRQYLESIPGYSWDLTNLMTAHNAEVFAYHDMLRTHNRGRKPDNEMVKRGEEAIRARQAAQIEELNQAYLKRARGQVETGRAETVRQNSRRYPLGQAHDDPSEDLSTTPAPRASASRRVSFSGQQQ